MKDADRSLLVGDQNRTIPEQQETRIQSGMPLARSEWKWSHHGPNGQMSHIGPICPDGAQATASKACGKEDGRRRGGGGKVFACT